MKIDGKSMDYRKTDEYRLKAAARMRVYRLKPQHKRYQWTVDLQRHYGVTPEWFEAQLAKQNGLCAICEKPEKMKIKGKLVRLAVDHDEATGRPRGLLCVACNRGIGMLKHDTTLLISAIAYLHKGAN
jgi:Recombination endonuclease VII